MKKILITISILFVFVYSPHAKAVVICEIEEPKYLEIRSQVSAWTLVGMWAGVAIINHYIYYKGKEIGRIEHSGDVKKSLIERRKLEIIVSNTNLCYESFLINQ